MDNIPKGRTHSASNVTDIRGFIASVLCWHMRINFILKLFRILLMSTLGFICTVYASFVHQSKYQILLMQMFFSLAFEYRFYFDVTTT